jgi:tetratricopeptide (TPR) repeat protein
MEEMTKDQQLLTPEIFDKNISKSYVQDLYRFFKLHPSGAEFTSYFDYSLGLHKTSLFDFFSSGNSLKSIVAEFYFAKSQYNEAIELFDEIIHDETPTAAVFQKMGYCFQQLSNIDAALAAYHKADLLQPDHLWTTKKLAFCYKISGNYNQALQYYQHADFIKPQQLNILFHISSCFVALKNYENALDVLDKIERIDVENLKAKRVIIWLSLLTGNVQKAAFYSETVLETSTLSTDFLHATYISMLENKISKALTNLQKAYQLAPNGTFDNLTKQINDEIKDLREAGVVINQLHLLLDAFAGTIN